MPANQGKINIDKVLIGKIKGMKKKDIGITAGSKAKSDQAICNAVTYAENTQEYKDKSNEYLLNIKKEIKRLITAISFKDLNGVDYDKAVSSLEKLNKMKQLLEGNSTDNIKISVQEVKGYLNNI
jgi:hypothetical protein